MTAQPISTVITTASGIVRRLPTNLEPGRVAGLDSEGRIVVDDFAARTSNPLVRAGLTMRPFMFGLTLCCNASDKGVEDGVACRGCYGMEEIGSYLHKADDGTFPGLDPVVQFRMTRTAELDAKLASHGPPLTISVTVLPRSVILRASSAEETFALYGYVAAFMAQPVSVGA